MTTKTPKFNSSQREGFARTCDSLAAVSLVTAIAAASGHNPLPPSEIYALITTAFILLIIGYYLRR